MNLETSGFFLILVGIPAFVALLVLLRKRNHRLRKQAFLEIERLIDNFKDRYGDKSAFYHLCSILDLVARFNFSFEELSTKTQSKLAKKALLAFRRYRLCFLLRHLGVKRQREKILERWKSGEQLEFSRVVDPIDLAVQTAFESSEQERAKLAKEYCLFVSIARSM